MGNRDIANISAVIDYIEAHLDRRLDLDALAAPRIIPGITFTACSRQPPG